LIPADNAGLGLARAVAVVRPDARRATKLPLSGGQLIGVDDTLTKGGGDDDPERRRIEMRVRRANSIEGPISSLTPPATTPVRPPASPPAAVAQTRAASPPAPPPVRRSPPRDPVPAPQWFPFGVAPSQAAPMR
jgi:hypothetical protein